MVVPELFNDFNPGSRVHLHDGHDSEEPSVPPRTDGCSRNARPPQDARQAAIRGERWLDPWPKLSSTGRQSPRFTKGDSDGSRNTYAQTGLATLPPPVSAGDAGILRRAERVWNGILRFADGQ